MVGRPYKYKYDNVVVLLSEVERPLSSIEEELGMHRGYLASYCKRHKINHGRLALSRGRKKLPDEERIPIINREVDVYKLGHCVLMKDPVEEEEWKEFIKETIKKNLTYREKEIIRLRFFSKTSDRKDIAEIFNISIERIRQVEQKALRKLKWALTKLTRPENTRLKEYYDYSRILAPHYKKYKEPTPKRLRCPDIKNNIDEILKLTKEGMLGEDIAKKLRIRYKTLQRYCRKHEILFKGRGRKKCIV